MRGVSSFTLQSNKPFAFPDKAAGLNEASLYDYNFTTNLQIGCVV